MPHSVDSKVIELSKQFRPSTHNKFSPLIRQSLYQLELSRKLHW